MNDKLLPAKDYLKEYRQKAIPELKKFFLQEKQRSQKIGQLPTESLDYFFKLCQRGKFIRGALIQLGYQLAGGKEKTKIVPLSLFIELFHTAILIHDDIMDEDKLRRGLPSAHSYFKDYGRKHSSPQANHFGISQAITLADTGFYLSWKILLDSSFPSSVKIKIGQLFSQYIVRLTYGQMLDLENILPIFQQSGKKRGNKLEDILKIFRYKTAEYTGSLPLLIGYLLGGGKKKEKLLSTYGLSFGWIFQITDDLLGIFGDQKKIGKPLGSDLLQAKKTILMYYLLQKGNKKQLEEIGKLMKKKRLTLLDIKTAREIFQESGAYHQVLELNQKYLHQGLKIIPQLTSKPTYRQLLESFLYLAFERQR